VLSRIVAFTDEIHLNQMVEFVSFEPCDGSSSSIVEPKFDPFAEKLKNLIGYWRLLGGHREFSMYEHVAELPQNTLNNTEQLS
jgi:hypothetical protein